MSPEQAQAIRNLSDLIGELEYYRWPQTEKLAEKMQAQMVVLYKNWGLWPVPIAEDLLGPVVAALRAQLDAKQKALDKQRAMFRDMSTELTEAQKHLDWVAKCARVWGGPS